MSDKVKELAEKLADRRPADAVDEYERILRAELEPLLEAAYEAAEWIRNNEAYSKFRAELKDWRP